MVSSLALKPHSVALTGVRFSSGLLSPDSAALVVGALAAAAACLAFMFCSLV